MPGMSHGRGAANAMLWGMLHQTALEFKFHLLPRAADVRSRMRRVATRSVRAMRGDREACGGAGGARRCSGGETGIRTLDTLPYT